MANNGKNIAILALNMMIDADPAQISKEALQIKQKVEDRIGSIELSADNERVIQAFQEISKYSAKFKNVGMDLTKIYSKIFEAFADPNKSMFDILEVINAVQSKLETLNNLEGYQLNMMQGFTSKQVDAVLAKYGQVTDILEEQGKLVEKQKKESAELFKTLVNIDKFETRKFSASSRFTAGGKYKEAISDDAVASLGKQLNVDTSDKYIYKDVQEYSKLIHILKVLNEEKKEYERDLSLSNKDDHLRTLKEEYSIYRQIEIIRSKIAKTKNVKSDAITAGLPEWYKIPELGDPAKVLDDKYKPLELAKFTKKIEEAKELLDKYIEESFEEVKRKAEQRYEDVKSVFQTKKATKSSGTGSSGTGGSSGESSGGQTGVTTAGASIENVSNESKETSDNVENLQESLQKVGKGSGEALDLWTESAKALKDEFGDLVKYAVSAEEALQQVNNLIDKQNPLKGNTALSTNETIDLLNYIERLYSLDADTTVDADKFYKAKSGHPKFKQTRTQIEDMTKKQLAEIERLKAAQKEVQVVIQESVDVQNQLEEKSENVERKMTSGAKASVEGYEELFGIVQKLSEKFESLSDISFLNSSSEELKQLFSSITSKFEEDLTEAVKNFKESLKNEDYGNLFDSIRENFTLVVKEFQNSLDNVNFSGNTNEVYNLLRQWNEASNILKKNGYVDNERSALLNASKGTVSNAYLYDKEGDFSARLLESLKSVSTDLSGKVGNVFDTWLHSHPIQKSVDNKAAYGADVGFSPADINILKNRFYDQEVFKMMVSSNGKYTSIDWEGISKEIITEVVKLYEQSDVFKDGKFRQSLALDKNGKYSFDKQSELLNNAIIDSMLKAGITDASSRLKTGDISELNVDLDNLKEEEKEATRQAEEFLDVLKQITTVLDSFNKDAFKFEGLDKLISDLGEIKQLLSSPKNVDLNIDKLSWNEESKDEIDAEINSIQLLKEKILEVRDAIDLKNEAFKQEEIIVENSSKKERENLRLLEVKLLDIIEALEEMQKSSIKNIFEFEEGDLVNLENVTEIARNWANSFLSEIQETLRNAEPVSVNVASTPAKDSDSYADKSFLEDFKDVSVDINVEPKVESPTDFVSKIEEQIKDLSVDINVNPKIDNIDGLVDKQDSTVETEENNKKSNRKYKVVKAPVIKTKKHEEKEPVDDDIVVKKETEDLDLLEQKIKSVTTAVDDKTAAFEKERQIVSLSVQDELADLDKLKDKLGEILQSLQGLISSPINISIDSSSIFKIDEAEEGANKSIENLKNGMKDLPIEDLKNLGQAFKGLQLPDNIAKNIGALATALEGLKKTLDANASPEGITFLNDIKELLAQSGKLKDLAAVLSAGERKVKKAKEALSDDSKNKTPKSLQFNIEDLTEKELNSKILTAENAIANGSSTADAWKEKLPFMKEALQNLVKQREEQERIAEETRKANIEEARKELLGKDYSTGDAVPNDDNTVNRNAIKQKGLVGDPEGWTTTYRLGETQTQKVVYSFDEQGHLDTKELPIATNFEQLLDIINTTEKQVYKLSLSLEENRVKFGDAYDSQPLENAIFSTRTYLSLLDAELEKYGTRKEYEADYQKYLAERQRRSELLFNLTRDSQNKNRAKSTLALESKDQTDLYGSLSKYTKEYIYWLNQEQSATGSARDVASSLREEFEKLIETLKTDIHSYGLQDLEKELELDTKILETRRKLNYQDEVETSKKAKASYERQGKLEEKINKLKINNLGADEKTKAKNDVRIKALEILISKEEQYRDAMELTDKAEEARDALINKRATLKNNLKVERKAYRAAVKAGNKDAKAKIVGKADKLKQDLESSIAIYGKADLSEAQSLLSKLKKPLDNWDVNSKTINKIVSKIENDTNRIIKALKKQHEKIESQTKFSGKMGEKEESLTEAIKISGSKYEGAKFKKAKISSTDGSATVTFLETIGDKAREITVYLNDVDDAINKIKAGTFDWNSVMAKRSDLRQLRDDDYEDVDSDATKNRVQSQIEAYQKLIKSEEEYYKLQAKVETDFATDKEIARYKELSHLRDVYNNLIKESIVLTEEEQKFYNTSGKKKLKQLEKNYKQKQSDVEGAYDVYRTDVFSDNLGAYISKNQNKQEELSKGRFTNVYILELDKVQEKLDKLNSFLPIDDVLDSDALDEIKQLKSEIDSILSKSKDDSVKLATETQVNTLKADLANLLKRNSGMLPDIKKDFKSLEEELESFGENLPIDKLNQFRATFQKLKADMENSGKVGNTFFEKIMDKVVYGWADIIARYLGLQDFIRYFQQIFEKIRTYNTVLTEMRKVSNETIDTLKEFQRTSFDLADSIGVTASAIQNSTADFMRLGYSLEDADNLAIDANIYANVGDMEIGEATEHMISSIQAWKSEFSNEVEASAAIIDRYNEIGNNFAITSADIGSAMERSAAALKAGGNTLNESLGLITAANLIQQDADTVANALKVVSLRIRGSKTDLEEMGESTDDLADSTSKCREELLALTGVDIMLDENTYKSTTQIIQEIGKEWGKLSDISKASALELLAGKLFA